MQRRLPYKIRTAGFYFKVLLLNVVCLFLIIKIIKFIQEPEIILGKYDDANADGIAPFESILKRDFPTLDLPFPRIPRVIHQTWKNENIPSEFHYNIRSFVNKNPEFKYYFWTDRTARKLIQKKYPRLLETFDNVVEPVRKADILRCVCFYIRSSESFSNFRRFVLWTAYDLYYFVISYLPLCKIFLLNL